METETIARLDQRLERIEHTMDRLNALFEQTPALVSIATDSVDDLVRNEYDDISLEERISGSLQLLKRLSDPTTQKALNGLLDFVDQAPGLISMMADVVDETVRISNQGDVTLDDRLKGGITILSRLSDPKMVRSAETLMDMVEKGPGLMAMLVDMADDTMRDNALLSPENWQIALMAGEAMTEAAREEPPKVSGIFSMLRTMRDPDRQKAVGFIMNVLKKLGKKLES